jgi:hypothetical protein
MHAGEKFPEEIEIEGYSKEELQKAFSNTRKGLPVLALTKPPTIKFYKQLHEFLARWDYTRGATKTEIGRFYIAIDPFLRQKGYLPHNAYTYIARRVAKHADSEDVSPTVSDSKENALGVIDHDKLAQFYSDEENHDIVESPSICSIQDTSQRQPLSNIANRMKEMTKCYEKKLQKAHELIGRLQQDMAATEAELEEMQEFCHSGSKETKVSNWSMDGIPPETEEAPADHEIAYETKEGGQYTKEIRKLYYNLLAHSMPPDKISSSIKLMLQHFLPHIDIDEVQLPQKSCAKYMRQNELCTINDIHKVTELSNSKAFHLNSDGTTLGQKKLGAATINGIVLSVNELPNGSAEQIAKDISSELERLRKLAHDLGLPNADSINWGLVTSSTSDSAATQKKFNAIVQQKRKEDIARFGMTDFSSEDLVTNFCSMHLGVNLRKAFIQGISPLLKETQSECTGGSAVNRQYSEIDTIVHEFSKVFGSKGVPEYGVGSVSFPDFLEVGMASSSDECEYYRTCQLITLDRQVGSRYFVTASNAAKLLVLRKAALQYLELFKKNKLERDLYIKLNDDRIMAAVKADSLMFLHIYSNLVTLSKSTILNKSAFDMRIHYLELDSFLELLEIDSRKALDGEIQVFTSEGRLYCPTTSGQAAKIAIRSRIFSQDKWDGLVVELVSVGALEMRSKLRTYARDFLPQGKYWDPPENVQKILKSIQPSNDICESILGLNDWLHNNNMATASQRTKRNLIEAKKNKTMGWLDSLSKEEQSMAIGKAMDNRKEAQELHKTKKEALKKERQAALSEQIKSKKITAEKLANLKDMLSNVMVIIGAHELDEILSKIDDEQTSVQKKRSRMKELIQMQVKLRKKLFHQNIKLNFTRAGKPVPMEELIQTFKKIIESNPIPQAAKYEPTDLVGKQIQHRFHCKHTKSNKWYNGLIQSYDEKTGTFEVQYEGEEGPCHFNLMADFAVGDLKIMAEQIPVTEL